MINSAEEFVSLRISEIMGEYERAAHESAPYAVWIDVIEKYPDFKKWVIHNKTVPIEILHILVYDSDPNVRQWVAEKRKIDDMIFNLLSVMQMKMLDAHLFGIQSWIETK